jgi:hypothetical protein
MKQLLRKALFIGITIGALTIMTIAAVKPSVISAFAQQKAASPPTTPLPQLTTAEKVAVQSLEKQKQEAATTWQNAQQQELSIMREWSQAHPGFRLHYNPANAQDPDNFTPEADTPAPSPKPPISPAEKK